MRHYSHAHGIPLDVVWPLALAAVVVLLLVWRFRARERVAASGPLTTSPPIEERTETPQASKRQRWKPRIDLINEGKGLMLDLQNTFAPEITGALACDVLDPRGGPPERLTIRPGIRDRVWCVYPDQFSGPLEGQGNRLMWGTYEVRWSEADEDWNWVEFARIEIEVAKPEMSEAERILALKDLLAEMYKRYERLRPLDSLPVAVEWAQLARDLLTDALGRAEADQWFDGGVPGKGANWLAYGLQDISKELESKTIRPGFSPAEWEQRLQQTDEGVES